MVNGELAKRLRLRAGYARSTGQPNKATLLEEAAQALEDSAGFRAALVHLSRPNYSIRADGEDARAMAAYARRALDAAETRGGPPLDRTPASQAPAPDPARPEFLVGIADEYGTIWSGEPGASERIGDLIERPDGETFEVRIYP